MSNHTNNVTDLNSPRIRFNWGFHDGAHDERCSVRPLWEQLGSTQPNRIYLDGYERGRRWQNEARYVDGKTLSDGAWGERRAEAAERKRIREMRPQPDRRC